LLECRRQVHALKEKCRRAPEVLKKGVERAQAEGQIFSLMEKDVYTEEARDLQHVEFLYKLDALSSLLVVLLKKY
jgi:hypothetical protein